MEKMIKLMNLFALFCLIAVCLSLPIENEKSVPDKTDDENSLSVEQETGDKSGKWKDDNHRKYTHHYHHHRDHHKKNHHHGKHHPHHDKNDHMKPEHGHDNKKPLENLSQ